MYGFEVAFHCMTSELNFMEIYRVVQMLLLVGVTDGGTDSMMIP